jgi:hypothetical protein
VKENANDGAKGDETDIFKMGNVGIDDLDDGHDGNDAHAGNLTANIHVNSEID